VFCIREELGSVNGITVTLSKAISSIHYASLILLLVGDLKNGRTVHSLVKVLSLYDVTLNFVSPPSLAMPDDVKAEASRANTRWYEHHSLDDVIGRSDVLYSTRVQKERFDNLDEYEAVKDLFVINNDVLARAKESAIVMHPLPRNNEIDPEVDFDSRRAAYFRQMRYGLFVSQVRGISANKLIWDRSGWRFSPLSLGHSFLTTSSSPICPLHSPNSIVRFSCIVGLSVPRN